MEEWEQDLGLPFLKDPGLLSGEVGREGRGEAGRLSITRCHFRGKERDKLGRNHNNFYLQGGGDGGGWGGGQGDERSCVVVVHNLASEFNCDKLFNLVSSNIMMIQNPILFVQLCQYGNVSKIFFMKTKEGCAMVEMADGWSAQVN